MKAGNQTSLKHNNQRAIIDYIINNGPTSRADLSKVLKISKPTVSANVLGLIESDLLKEIGYSETEIGKKPILVDFNKNHRYILALDFISYINRGSISCSVCNLYCEPIFIENIKIDIRYSASNIKNDVPEKIFEICKRYNIPLDKIEKLVLTASTAWYDEKNIPLQCPFTNETVNLAEVFEPWFKGKIAVKNDVNLAALGEKYFGVGKSADNLVYIWAGLAVGGGIILNGELYEGKHMIGGELAKSSVYNEYTGKMTCLMDICSNDGLREYVSLNKNEADKSAIGKHIEEEDYYLDMVSDAAKKGDEFCIEYGKFVGRKFAQVIINLVYTLDLDMAIVSGEYVDFGDIFLDEIKKALKEIPNCDNVKISLPLHYDSAMYGAFKIGADSIIEKLI